MYTRLEGSKIAQLLEIIDRNRWDQIRRQTALEPISTNEEDEKDEIRASDVTIVIFASETPFSESIVKMFSNETVIASFNDPEKTINFCCDNSILNMILDIDPPSDCHQAMDVFIALKILNPRMQFFICTKRQNSGERNYFEKHGSTVFLKPVLRKQVKWIRSTMI